MAYAPALFFAGDGVTPVDVNADGVPAFIRELSAAEVPPSGGSRCYYAVAPGAGGAQPPYQVVSDTRANVRASLLVASPTEFAPVDFPENAAAPAPVVTVNAGATTASLVQLDASQLAPGVAAACRLTYNGGAYVDVQGTRAAVSAALAAVSPAPSGIVGPEFVAYVDVNGTAGGVVGNAAKPFATIAQAFAALALAVPTSTTPCKVSVGPGVFTGDVGAIPVGLRRVAIEGAGPQLTTIQTLTLGSDLFDLGVGVARDAFGASLFTALAPGGRLCRYDGGAQLLTGDAFGNGALALGFTGVAGLIDVKRLGTFVLPGLATLFGGLNVETVGQWLCFRPMLANGTINFTQDWDDANRPPALDLSATWLGVLASDVNLEKQAYIEGEGCNIDGMLTTATGLTVSSAGTGNKIGGFQLGNSIVRDCDFGSVPLKQFPDFAGGGARAGLPGGRVRDNLLVRVQAPAAHAISVDLTDVTFEQLAPVIGAGVHADGRGVVSRDPSGALFFTPDASGDVIPPTFATAWVAVAGFSQIVPLPFRLRSAQYRVAVDCDDATTLPLAVVTRTANDFEVVVSIVAGNVAGTVTWAGF